MPVGRRPFAATTARERVGGGWGDTWSRASACRHRRVPPASGSCPGRSGQVGPACPKCRPLDELWPHASVALVRPRFHGEGPGGDGSAAGLYLSSLAGGDRRSRRRGRPGSAPEDSGGQLRPDFQVMRSGSCRTLQTLPPPPDPSPLLCFLYYLWPCFVPLTHAQLLFSSMEEVAGECGVRCVLICIGFGRGHGARLLQWDQGQCLGSAAAGSEDAASFILVSLKHDTDGSDDCVCLGP